MLDLNHSTIAIIGLGYVGLPLAVEFGKFHRVIGYDIDESRVNELKNSVDRTEEVTASQLESSEFLSFTSYVEEIRAANIYIVTVPTPVDLNHRPDLTPLKNASRTVANILNSGDVVIYESTVYPGATEEDCVPILQQDSGLMYNEDFYVGYSPERINPGDKERKISTIKKVTSGSTPEVAAFVDSLYQTIITAGTYKAESIKVAEAAKVIENTQRDLNIALINELAIIFNHLDIDTQAVLNAAATKWNFLPFKPGLVGGHCIGIDPYYLTHKAESLGYHPDVILAGRKINDGMGKYVVSRLIKEMVLKRIHVSGAKILILGFAFKENCGDIRNTKVIDIVHGLEEYDANVDVYDPVIDTKEAFEHYRIDLIDSLRPNYYDAIVIAVAHEEFCSLGVSELRRLAKKTGLIYDLKCIFDSSSTDLRL